MDTVRILRVKSIHIQLGNFLLDEKSLLLDEYFASFENFLDIKFLKNVY